MPYTVTTPHPTHPAAPGEPLGRTGRRKALRTRAAVLGAALTAALSLGAVTAPPAAAGNPYFCPQSKFCLWEDSNYDGAMATAVAGISWIGPYMNDRGSSYWNRTGEWVTLYRDIDFQGGCLMGSIAPQESATVLSAQANDQTSSFRFSRDRIC
ncbi:peptidase inhibitor family I36 protein [Streptomyces clavuligerus]|nr:peptidase inhibitor family I36 protein [Streptomyces clavuligerus]WDN57633.1 peptidase inhibitor family I36 protein [Streptomyces clavuligerus]